MTQEEMLVKQKLSLLQLANELDNIKKACNTFGVSRQHYYNVKKRFDQFGTAGLKPQERSKPVMPNQTGEDIEKKILKFSLDNPAYGKDRLALELRGHGIYITPNGVRSIWKRNKMCSKKDRFKALEKKMAKDGFMLSPDQLEQLVLQSKNAKDRHIISYFPGYLLCQDTFEVGTIKGIGRIYMQVVIDSYGSFAFAKLYNYKTSLTAADILVDKVLPFYKSFSLPILNILTDNGTEYCGRFPKHDYQLVLNLFKIRHRRIKPGHPQTNGFVERFNRTVYEEFLLRAFRTKWYYSIEQLQTDLDEWMLNYNFKRSHQGYRVKGSTPAKVLLNTKNWQKQLTVS